mgnify:CR=1 FL=1
MRRNPNLAIGLGLGAVALIGAAGLAVAQEFGRGMHGGWGRPAAGERMFERLDADGDGKVTRAEIDAARAADLATYDANRDGVLSVEEFAELHAARTRDRMVRHFQFLDADGDGKVTEAEMEAPAARMLRRLDADGDGAVTREEVAEARRGMGGRQGMGRGTGRGTGQGMGRGMGPCDGSGPCAGDGPRRWSE